MGEMSQDIPRYRCLDIKNSFEEYLRQTQCQETKDVIQVLSWEEDGDGTIKTHGGLCQ